MLPVHSPYGCPGDYFHAETDKKIKLIIDPKISYFYNDMREDRKNYDILVLIHGMEPREINDISIQVIQHHNQFDKVLSSYPEVVSSCNNAELFLYASSWILTKADKSRADYRKDYTNIFTTNKKFSLSFVMSQKQQLPGHILRFKAYNTIVEERAYELIFPSSIPIDYKYKLFEDSMFHIAIENTKNINYISEKIVDCFMSFTLPIYWGCPTIGNFFNTDGIIQFNDERELASILDSLTPNDYYKRLEAIVDNYKIASEKYAFHADRVNECINKLLIK